MITYDDLGKHRKAILWKNDLPFSTKREGYLSKKVIQLSEPLTSNSTSFALELSLPRNSAYYALLGVEYIPVDTTEIVIEVNISESVKERYESLLKNEPIYIGIPAEYASSIIETAEQSLNAIGWQYSGKLKFSIGAHSVVGSSPSIFSRVCRILVSLLSNSLTSKTQKDEEEIIISELNN